MAGPQPSAAPERGDAVHRVPGYSYLPRFFDADEAQELQTWLAGLHPIWEQRYAQGHKSRRGGSGRLTRPVYWLGAWQFAALGYYLAPDHVEDRAVRAEPIPDVMLRVLERLRPELATHGSDALPNTCLLNFYGSERPERGPPVDTARLRMHRDREPGPVVMLSIGQPAQLEFVDGDAQTIAHAQWVRHRSAVILSGPEYKDRLYHRVTRVRHGQEPHLTSQLAGFAVRRISASFRHVSEDHIRDLSALGADARAIAQPYVETLARHSAHFRAQLEGLTAPG